LSSLSSGQKAHCSRQDGKTMKVEGGAAPEKKTRRKRKIRMDSAAKTKVRIPLNGRRAFRGRINWNSVKK